MQGEELLINNHWTCFAQGWQAWNKYFTSNWENKVANPYDIDSEDWRSWNRGWNLNNKGIDLDYKDFCESCGSASCIC